MVAAISALINTLPRSQRINTDDILLPIASLTSPYPLMLTLGALFSHATIALNSVAGDNVDFALAASNISPTIIVSSSQSALKYHDRLIQTQQGLLPRLSRYWQNKTLINGNMPKNPSFAPPGHRDFTSKLRLLYIYHRAEDKSSPRLSSEVLTNLKILLGVRTCYALTAPGVAGAVAQTNVYDYRQTPGKDAHFGPPVSCVEVLLVGADEKLGGGEPEGKVSSLPSINGDFEANESRSWSEVPLSLVERRRWM
jgi:hypothetical protein